jgi:hypothetical protein
LRSLISAITVSVTHHTGLVKNTHLTYSPLKIYHMHISSLNCAKTMSPPTNDSDNAEGEGGLGQRLLFAAAATALAEARQRWRKSGGSVAALAAETMTTTITKATAALAAAVAARHQQKRGGGGGVVSLVAAPVLASARR